MLIKSLLQKNLAILISFFYILFSNTLLLSSDNLNTNYPHIYSYNKDIDFYSINENVITSSTNYIIKVADVILLEILEVPDSLQTFNNSILKLDDLYNHLYNISNTLELFRSVHPNLIIRDQSETSIMIIEEYLNKLSSNTGLYNKIKAYSKTNEVRSLSKSHKRFLLSELRDFKYSGLNLSSKKRNALMDLENQNTKLILKFENNLNSHLDTLFFDKKSLKGLPDDYLESRIQDDSKYAIDLSYPSYYSLMKYADSDSIRKLLHYKFHNRGMPENNDILSQLLGNRKSIANLLGYDTYSDLNIENSMAKSKDAVLKFENMLLSKISKKANYDTKELIKLKNQRKSNENNEIFSWDKYYYENKLLINKYNVNSEIVKEYFKLENVLEGLFTISKLLFNINIIQVENPSVWHKDVMMFNVYDINNNAIIAKFYLDLFPRENKYQHAAAFSIINGKKIKSGYQLPISSLVCNFPNPTAIRPSLLLHDDVETLFHEFGHLLHDILTTSELVSQSGTSVASDFVEAPAQAFENWAWNKQALKLFAFHYDTGEIIPDDLLNKMILAKTIQSGNNLLQQIFYGILDLELHGDFTFYKKDDLYKITSNLQNKITNYKHHKYTHQYASFDHLLDYGSSYYGYLWSEVYALDIYSIFKNEGVLSSEIGLRFRKTILEKGSTEDPMKITEQFLKRSVNPDAFLKKMGID